MTREEAERIVRDFVAASRAGSPFQWEKDKALDALDVLSAPPPVHPAVRGVLEGLREWMSGPYGTGGPRPAAWTRAVLGWCDAGRPGLTPPAEAGAGEADGASATPPVPRCDVCDWPIAGPAGCTPGSCSYRPAHGTPEYERIQNRRRALPPDHYAHLPTEAATPPMDIGVCAHCGVEWAYHEYDCARPKVTPTEAATPPVDDGEAACRFAAAIVAADDADDDAAARDAVSRMRRSAAEYLNGASRGALRDEEAHERIDSVVSALEQVHAALADIANHLHPSAVQNFQGFHKQIGNALGNLVRDLNSGLRGAERARRKGDR